MSCEKTMPTLPPIQPDLPDKRYFRIGEVSAITGLKTYVLRFWETEFKEIRPTRSRSGQRLYRKEDVEVILKIKHLLYERKYTIPGAIQYLKNNKQVDAPSDPLKTLSEIRAELEAIRDLLR